MKGIPARAQDCLVLRFRTLSEWTVVKTQEAYHTSKYDGSPVNISNKKMLVAPWDEIFLNNGDYLSTTAPLFEEFGVTDVLLLEGGNSSYRKVGLVMNDDNMVRMMLTHA